jgi:hypothetical protein
MRILLITILLYAAAVAAIAQPSLREQSEGMTFYVESDVLKFNGAKFTKLYYFDASTYGETAKFKHFKAAMGAKPDRVVKDRLLTKPNSYIAKCYDKKGVHFDLLRRPNMNRLLTIYFFDKENNVKFDNNLWIGDYLVDGNFAFAQIGEIKNVAHRSELGNFITLKHDNSVKKGFDIIFEFDKSGALESLSIYINAVLSDKK